MPGEVSMPQVSERWVPKSGRPGGFVRLKSPKKGEYVFEVERFIPSKEAPSKLEKRTRTMNHKDVRFFILGYERES